MATTVYSEVLSYESWWFFTRTSRVYEEDLQHVYPYPLASDITVQHQNKVWDSIAGQWVYWNTDYPDVGGMEYPGPGIWDVETSQFAVEAIVLGRHELV